MKKRMRWRKCLLVSAVITVLVSLTFTWLGNYHLRNFRNVETGVLYRSGQLTPTGLRYAIQRHGIKTVVSLRTVRDPGRPYLDDWEVSLCGASGARHIRIIPRSWLVDKRGERPADQMVNEFFAIMDDPSNHPVLIHCFAGIHRTGTLIAIYRMEFQGWSADCAIREMETCGFLPGPNREAIEDYLRAYRPRGQASNCGLQDKVFLMFPGRMKLRVSALR